MSIEFKSCLVKDDNAEFSYRVNGTIQTLIVDLDVIDDQFAAVEPVGSSKEQILENRREEIAVKLAVHLGKAIEGNAVGAVFDERLVLRREGFEEAMDAG